MIEAIVRGCEWYLLGGVFVAGAGVVWDFYRHGKVPFPPDFVLVTLFYPLILLNVYWMWKRGELE